MVQLCLDAGTSAVLERNCWDCPTAMFACVHDEIMECLVLDQYSKLGVHNHSSLALTSPCLN